MYAEEEECTVKIHKFAGSARLKPIPLPLRR
jgi:hypothetical protein